jgi:hypothetical protein
LTGGGCSVLRRDVLRAIVIRGLVVVECLKLHLQLTFALTSSFDLSALGGQSSFLLLGIFGSSFSALLLFGLLELALLNLLFQGTKPSLSGFPLLGKFILLSTLLVPSVCQYRLRG